MEEVQNKSVDIDTSVWCINLGGKVAVYFMVT